MVHLSVKPICQNVFETVFYLSDSKSPECMVSIIVCPSTSDTGTICSATCAKLAGLKDFFACCKIEGLLPVQQERVSKTPSALFATGRMFFLILPKSFPRVACIICDIYTALRVLPSAA